MTFIHLFSYRAIMCGHVWSMHDVHPTIHYAFCHEHWTPCNSCCICFNSSSAFCPSPHISHVPIPLQSKWPHLKMASCSTPSNINLFSHFAYMATKLVSTKNHIHNHFECFVHECSHLPYSSTTMLAHAFNNPQKNHSSATYFHVAFVQIVPLPPTLAHISHVPLSWRSN